MTIYEPPALASDWKATLRWRFMSKFAPLICFFRGHRPIWTDQSYTDEKGVKRTKAEWTCERKCGYKG